MFRHPNVIAAFIVSIGMLVSAALICVFLHSLDQTIDRKPVGGGGTRVAFPQSLKVYSDGSSPLYVTVRNDQVGPDVKPLIVQQK